VRRFNKTVGLLAAYSTGGNDLDQPICPLFEKRKGQRISFIKTNFWFEGGSFNTSLMKEAGASSIDIWVQYCVGKLILIIGRVPYLNEK
jgi:hypothetical protein